MRSFDYSKLQNCTIDTEVLGFISKIWEYKGRQTLYVHQKKDKVDKLVEIAKIQSTESSNKIEGIVTTELRIKQLIADKTTLPFRICRMQIHKSRKENRKNKGYLL